MFRGQQHHQENLQQRLEDSIRRQINAIDLKSGEDLARSLEAIEAILGMLQGNQFSRKFINDMYYETRDKVDEHHNRKIDMDLPFEIRRAIGLINVKFGDIHSVFEGLWSESRNNLNFS